MRTSPIILLVLFVATPALHANPEFHRFIVKNSGRSVDCALCHVNRDGPEGTGPGQVGHLTPAELEKLGRARAALAPGMKPESPILNLFGNHIINSIGKQKFAELRLAPEQLAKTLPKDSDLDHDGIPDAQEYLDGTHPLMKSDGRPWLLFKNNLRTNLLQILLATGATVIGLFGLRHLLNGFAIAVNTDENDEDENKEQHP
ncbi:MAG: hypothetical protein HZC54_25455 [Verrucomicrobia bacterium]|nr:hypothetical protein [Verrucomicrobiota bacterium]